MSTTAEEVAWQTRAQCVGVDPEVFFPDRGQPTRIAKWICRRCPVQRECLDYALAARIDDGIWGGLSGIEREPLFPSAPLSPAPRRRPERSANPVQFPCGCGCEGLVSKTTLHRHGVRARQLAERSVAA